ncbi:MAG: MATE family efflux transporter [Oscillospiraceae bacterium]|nr:MATE family efflux transporter [Oscillospiraceae bacterium]MBR5262034.1 MATE family efflux transporter [Oscillospiraceae bacterium]
MTLKKHNLFGSAHFYKGAVTIALPVMLQMLIQNMVSLIDNFMVAGLGDIKMSGVNISGQILFIFMVLIGTICTSGGIYMTQYYGAGNKRGMQQSLCFKLLVGSVAVIVYMFVCMVIPRNVLSLMVIGNSEAELILDEAVKYMFLMGFVGIPMTVSNVFSSSLREIGKVKIPLVVSVIATLINTFFNWVLIYGNLGAPRLEVQGAAIATIIARTAEMLMFIIYAAVKKPPFMIRLSDLLHIDFSLFRKIMKRGYMVLFSEMLWVVSETVCTALYNSRGGADVVSGMASSFAIANLFFVAFGGMNTATSVILGHTLGRGELELAKRQKRWLLSASVIFGIIMGCFGLVTMFLVPIVFVNLSASAVAICSKMVMAMSIMMPMWVYINAQFAVARSGGDTAMGMWVDGTTTVIIILPGMFYVALCTSMGPVWMYILVKLVDLIKIAIAHFWLKKEHWVKNLALPDEI